jgi:tetratricopeptide (TPR) repeat protein/GGDEF domain-containing protein
MAIDVAKHLERAKKYLERNKLREAAQEYETVLQEFPQNQESIQALGDIYTRLNEPERAAKYYGIIFDRFADSRDYAKAQALYTRFLKPYPQPADRMARFALLLQKQNKSHEAIEFYESAAEQFLASGNEAEALGCWDKIAQLDPDNPARQLKIGELGERMNKPDIAARGFLRAGQLSQASGDTTAALNHLSRAHKLAPGDRGVCLVYGEVLLSTGQAARTVELLEPFAATESDTAFLEVFGSALMQTGALDRASAVFQKLYGGRTDRLDRFFELAARAIQAGHHDKGVDILRSVKERMFAARKQNEFLSDMDRLLESQPKSIPLHEFCGQVYNELNRDSKYFSVLEHMFELYMATGNIRGACDSLDRLVDIDPYDFNNQNRLKQLEGKAEPGFINSVTMRMAKAAVVGGQAAPLAPDPAAAPAPIPTEGPRARQALDDMLVQAEIFMQYSLQNKAIEWLQKIAAAFPGEEERNERLRNLYNQANWWPAGKPAETLPITVPATAVGAPGAAGGAPAKGEAYSAETISDLAKISEITRAVYRQSTPKTVLSTAVTEIGKYLNVTRCIAVVGPPGQPPQMASEYCAPGVTASGAGLVVKLLGQLTRAVPDALGGLQLRGANVPVLGEIGLEAALGVQLVDKETQTPAGMVVVANATAREWKPNESYFLQAVGDQVLMCVNHTKLRSLMRTLAVADVKTGVLGPGSYQDCLLAESNRAKMETAPLSLIILQLDHGPELTRQQGEPMIERYMEQLVVALQAGLRQNDLAVKYTAWSLAFILPNTALANARTLAEKLRKVSAGVRPPWDQAPLKLSAAAVEAVTRPDYDSEDIVTDLINRVEFCLEDARKRGGDVVVAP